MSHRPSYRPAARPFLRRTAERSNLYSESRLSNWAPFDPYDGEINALTRRLDPVLRVSVNPGDGEGDEADGIPVYERPVHPAFVRPVTAADVAAVLRAAPPGVLRGLAGVYLLGGTRKQERASRSDLFRFGCYGGNRVYLFALPRREREQRFARAPKPSVQHDYRRCGARVDAASGPDWVCGFTDDALRRFYLYDVLLHELAHHADRRNYHKNDRQAERYAEWFARHHADRVRRG